ncbi:MAG: Dabb family protein [Pseudomonadota bacterium]
MVETTQLRHVVMFKFKDGTGPDETAEIVRRFSGLQDLVPGIEAFEWGVNNSPEALSEGLTHCFTLTFGSEAARDAYLPYPEHKAFADWVGNWVEKVVVVDYWAKPAAS